MRAAPILLFILILSFPAVSRAHPACVDQNMTWRKVAHSGH
jgi:hypothetical protein